MTLLLKNGTKCLVLPVKTEPDEAIPLLETDRWEWSPGLNAHHRGVDLWRWSKVVSADFQQVGYTCQELCVDGEATVEGITGVSYKSHRKLSLEHDNSATKRRAV